MDHNQLVTWAFQGLATGVAIYAASELGRLRQSIDELAINLAKIGVKNESHEKMLEKHDSRLSMLEQKGNR